jgi:glycosyltransferase involved in cell wall biosynthesis
VVAHEQTGLIVPSDSPDQLASAVSRLLHDEKLLHRLRDNGRRHAVETFDLTSVAQRYRDLLLTLND